MNIKSAQFIKSIVGDDPLLGNGIPQIAFIGRSNVGKSSVINSLVNQKALAKTSSFPGHTQQINLFLINKAFYLVDLPGYGHAEVSTDQKGQIQGLVSWYFFNSNYDQEKVVVIIDAKVGPTKDDMKMLYNLEKHEKHIIVVANKVDKIKKSLYDKQLAEISEMVKPYKVIPYSAEKRFGVNELSSEIAS